MSPRSLLISPGSADPPSWFASGGTMLRYQVPKGAVPTERALYLASWPGRSLLGSSTVRSLWQAAQAYSENSGQGRPLGLLAVLARSASNSSDALAAASCPCSQRRASKSAGWFLAGLL